MFLCPVAFHCQLMNIAKYLFLLYFFFSSSALALLSDDDYYYYLLNLFVSFICKTYICLRTKAEVSSPSSCPIPFSDLGKRHDFRPRVRWIISQAINISIHTQSILTVHFQKKSNPTCPNICKHFDSAVTLGFHGLIKQNKHYKE